MDLSFLNGAHGDGDPFDVNMNFPTSFLSKWKISVFCPDLQSFFYFTIYFPPWDFSGSWVLAYFVFLSLTFLV